ncbi:hypothetical protein [Amphritea sp. HPY]|uniref:hypothetical protein n=1 Tax=Amphritea sp. HPY TaxID=3421652 RepID=UPI003D7ED428
MPYTFVKTLIATLLCLGCSLPLQATADQPEPDDTQPPQISIEELQQFLDRFDPTLLQQMFDSLNLQAEELGQEAENYLQCLEQQQAISPSEPMDLRRFISEALTTGKVCQFLLDDLVRKIQQQQPDSDTPQASEKLLDQSL